MGLNLSHHIMPTSATMVGVCMTVIGIVRLLERGATATYTSEILAVDAVFFLASTLLSFMSLRMETVQGQGRQSEKLADWLFLLGLLIMVAAAIMLAWKIG